MIMGLLHLLFLQGVTGTRFVPYFWSKEGGESGLSGKFDLNSFTWLDRVGVVATGHPSGGRD